MASTLSSSDLNHHRERTDSIRSGTDPVSLYQIPTNSSVNYNPQQSEDELPKKNLWHKLLDDVGVRKDLPQAHVLVLGDKGCGKRSLVKHINSKFMQYVPNNKMDEYGSDFANFDCSYMFYKDIHEAGFDDFNIQSRINVWLISDVDMGSMIPKIIKPADLEYTFAIIMPDMEEPWNIMA